MPLVRARASSLSLVLLAGCGAGAPMGPGPVDAGGPGAGRLRPWQLAPQGAPPVLLGITDTVEGQRCTFLADSEGQLRCLPPSPPTLWSASEFADALCTTPLYRVNVADPAAFVGRPLTLPVLPRTRCEPQRHVVGIVRVVPDAAPRYQNFSGGCAETPPSRSPGELGIAVDEVVAPARFVAGTVVDGARIGGRVREREIVTADGARFVDHLVDERWGKRCTLGVDDGDTTTCGVEELRESSFFRDAACETGALARAEACADPAFLRAGSEPFTLGPRWSGAVFERTKGCHLAHEGAPTTDEIAPVFYERGAPLDGDVVARATWDAEGAARLATRGLRGDDGGVVLLGDAMRGEHTPAFHDNVTGEACRAIATSAGEVRCVPSRVRGEQTIGRVFADAACTKLAYFCQPGDCDGFQFVSADPVTFRPASATSPGARLSIAVAVPRGSAYSNFEGPCVATDTWTLYTTGADVPWDTYPLVPVSGASLR